MINGFKTSYVLYTILNNKVTYLVAVYINTEGHIMYFKYHMPMINGKSKLYKFFKVNYNG